MNNNFLILIFAILVVQVQLVRHHLFVVKEISNYQYRKYQSLGKEKKCN